MRSPWGSITVTPVPAEMSQAAMFRSRVLLPAPVVPKIAMCLRLASGRTAKCSSRAKSGSDDCLAPMGTGSSMGECVNYKRGGGVRQIGAEIE